MWITSFDSTPRSTTLVDSAIEILVEPRTSETNHLAVIRVTIPPATAMPRQSHGDSDAVIIPLDGELLLVSGYGSVERLVCGMVAAVAAHERISVENHTAQPASMLVCFAPPAFVETLAAAPASPVNGASC
jgi:quercetin dioxygenase-like cupin family protein